ncbi:MAG TPA: hypothetical protein VJB98_02175 [Candidatus Paceibacterota bacterium]
MQFGRRTRFKPTQVASGREIDELLQKGEWKPAEKLVLEFFAGRDNTATRTRFGDCESTAPPYAFML